MNLETRYLGMTLSSPLVVGAAPLADSLDTARKLEDGGAAAIVVRSLFAERVALDQIAQVQALGGGGSGFARALDALPEGALHFDPEGYVRHISALVDAIDVPVIASINAWRSGSWTGLLPAIAGAGARALELSLHALPTRPDTDAPDVETLLFETTASVCDACDLPVAVKLTPQFTALPHAASLFAEMGARALVLFNRFYARDIDVDACAYRTVRAGTTSGDLLARIQWLSILAGRVPLHLAASGGVHRPEDVVKALLAGADIVQIVSALIERGPDHLTTLRNGLVRWMEANGHETLDAFRGRLSLHHVDPEASWERTSFIEMLDAPALTGVGGRR